MSDSSTQHEYIVTVKAGVDWQVVNDELTRDTAADASVDSAKVPDRSVDVAKLRSNNKRNTHYALTDAEAQALRNDSRIEAVQKRTTIGLKKLSAIQSGPFNRSSSGGKNWGLLRHTNTSSVPPLGSTSTNSYNYVLDGTGVDVVIQDTGVQADHPEFQDAQGISRVQQIDWSAYDSDWTSGSVLPYQDLNEYGHGTHVAGTVAGKTHGWAKNARIYSQNNVAETSAMNDFDAFDSLLTWHNSKNGSRPTVVNMSYGFVTALVSLDSGNGFMFLLVDGTSITINNFTQDSIGTGGFFRGASQSTTQLSFWQGRGCVLDGPNNFNGYEFYWVNNRVPSIDADVQQCLDAGIVFVQASGNDSQKIDVPGGQDWDNRLTGVGGTIESYYYCRGASPTTDTGDNIVIGALSTSGYESQESKAPFSNSGPGIDLYAAGESIYSSVPTNSYGYLQGTSMASPQVAGMCACLLQAHPDWTPAQVKNWMINNASLNEMYTPDIADDSLQHFETYPYTDRTLNTGPNRIAYFPMNGASPFGYSSS